MKLINIFLISLISFIGLASFAESGAQGRMGVVRAWNQAQLPVSVVSEEEIQNIFKRLANESIAYNYPENGCHARAYEMGLLMEKQGLISVKVFIVGHMKVQTQNSPKGFVIWGFHVAPILLVDVNGKEKMYILDPSLFDRAVPYETWFDLLALDSPVAKGEQKPVLEDYIASRTVYHTRDLETDTGLYDPIDVGFKTDLLAEIAEAQGDRVRENNRFAEATKGLRP